jgi:hypothetical protein
MPRPISDNIERFWRHTKVDGACVVWTGWLDRDGYGRFAPRLESGRYLTSIAHRWIYQQTFGALHPSTVLMHSCDRPACVSLTHLSPGTQRDNQHDAISKGRHTCQMRLRAAAKIDADTATEIRNSTEPGRTLAARYGLSESTISNIRRGKTWRP